MLRIPLSYGAPEVLSVDGPGLVVGSMCSCLSVFHCDLD